MVDEPPELEPVERRKVRTLLAQINAGQDATLELLAAMEADPRELEGRRCEDAALDRHPRLN